MCWFFGDEDVEASGVSSNGLRQGLISLDALPKLAQLMCIPDTDVLIDHTLCQRAQFLRYEAQGVLSRYIGVILAFNSLDLPLERVPMPLCSGAISRPVDQSYLIQYALYQIKRKPSWVSSFSMRLFRHGGKNERARSGLTVIRVASEVRTQTRAQ